MDHDATCYEGRPRPKRHYVRCGPSSPPQKGGRAPQFLAHVCCGQMTAWINLPFDAMVGLGPGNIVLDADPAPSPKGHSPQISAHVCCCQTAGWMKMPLGTKVGLGPGCIVLHWDPILPPKRGTAPSFRFMSIVAQRLDGRRCHLVRK